MAEDPDEALPGLPLLLAQGAADVGEDEQAVGEPSLSEGAAPGLEAARPARQGEVEHARLARRVRGLRRPQRLPEAQLLGAPAEELLGRPVEQPLPRAVHQAQAPLVVEREHRHVDLLHDLAEEGGGLQGAQTLLAQGLRERVHLQHGLGERIVALGPPGPEREVLLAERGQQVREGLQGTDDVLLHREGEGQPEPDHQESERPLHLAAEIGRPEQAQGGHRTGEPGEERHQEDAPFVGDLPTTARGHSAAGAGRARCATGRGPPRPGSRSRRSGRAPS